MDTISPERRSADMRRIRGRDTGPELVVRRFPHRAGLRFRLYRSGLPGRPDLVFPAMRTCLFVHGCFWHGCRMCRTGRRRVKSNAGYWQKKTARTRRRDRQNELSLIRPGWTAITVWACETDNEQALERMARRLAKLQPAPADSRKPRDGRVSTRPTLGMTRRLGHHRARMDQPSRKARRHD
jgi:DNA mismatch endonuclease (patch repair protein)